MKKKFISVISLLAAVCIVFTACSSNGEDKSDTESVSADSQSGGSYSADLKYVDENGDIVIPLEDISEEAVFADIEYNGRVMEVFAVKASNGEVHCALNTCQVCKGSPLAYFVQSGSDFICQNCKNSFSADAVGEEHGGCNPVPVGDFELTDEALKITREQMASYYDDFDGWKGINS